MRSAKIATAASACLALALAERHAEAYPHFQLSSGSSQCSQCHTGPAGGGLLTAWGRGESSDTLARGGDGSFLHGLVELPDWLALGGELRLATLANDVGGTEPTELAAFPMQLDLAARVTYGAWALALTVGARGRVRDASPRDPDGPGAEATAPPWARTIVSREHYLMWRAHPGQTDGAYLRVGRFAAPYGLRLADHTAYVRRYLGFNLLEESYGLGGGYSGDDWELHVTAFGPDLLQDSTRDEFGGALLYEKQLSANALLGGSARLAKGELDRRAQVGAHGKLWLERASVLLQAEIDGARQTFEAGDGRWQLAAYAGPVLVPTRGVFVGAGYQLFAEDLQIRAVTRHAAELWLSLLPRAHLEVLLLGRAQRVGPDERAYLGLFQLHYSL